MTEFWLISAPGDRSPQQTFEKCTVVTRDLSMNYKISLPELKVYFCYYNSYSTMLNHRNRECEINVTTIKQVLRQGYLGHSLTFLKKQAGLYRLYSIANLTIF